MKAEARVTVHYDTCEYDDLEEAEKVVQSLLNDLFRKAAGEGMLSGYTPLTVDTWYNTCRIILNEEEELRRST